jgi:hypothetical protein
LPLATTPMTTNFFVEPTDYGWSVRSGSKNVGLFVTQSQALNDVKKRRAKLAAMGHDSTLSVTGSDPKPIRPSWPRR